MAVTIQTGGITNIWDAESTTGAVGNKPGLEPEIIKENANSIGFTTTQTNTNCGYNGTGVPSTLTTSDHIRIWYTSITFPNMASKALGGMRLYATDGNNTAYWYLEGKDTYQGGWVNAVVGLGVTPDEGTLPTLSNLSEIGIIHGNGTGTLDYATRPKNLINAWVDYFRYGDGYIVTATNGNFGEITIGDDSAGYGIVVENDGVNFMYGSLQLGRATEATTFSETGSVIVFADAFVNTGLYGITWVGHASSTFSFDGCVITSPNLRFYLDFDDAGIVNSEFINNAISNASNINFKSSGITVSGNTFVDISSMTIPCAVSASVFDTIASFTLSATLTGCRIVDSVQVPLTTSGSGLSGGSVETTTNATSAVLLAPDLGSVSGVNFVGNSVTHALEINALPASGTLSWNSTFDNTTYAATNEQTSSVIYINPGTSSTPLTIQVTGGDTPSYRRGTGYTGVVTVVAGATPTITVNVKDANGSVDAIVYINDSLTTLKNETTVSGSIAKFDYAAGQTSATIRVRKWGYYHYEGTVSIGTGDNVYDITLVADAQQSGTFTNDMLDTWTDVPASETFGWTSGTNVDSVYNVYRWLMDKYTNTLYTQYQSPMRSVTATQYELINGWKFTNTTDYQHLKGGTIVDSANNQTWANVTSIGAIRTTGIPTGIYVVQGTTKLTTWWADGHIDILVEVRNSSGTWLSSVDDNNSPIDGGIWIFARDYGNLYSSFFANLSGGGRTTIPISTAADLNNTTSNTTVSGYNNITVTFGLVSRSLDATNFFNYDVEINLQGRTLQEFYEYTKYITSELYSTTDLQGTIDGYEYRNASPTTYTGADVQQAPFGTFAGGKFFGAQGVFITNMAGADANNYELKDNLGAIHTPPITASFTLTGLVDNTEVRIYDSTLSTELYGIEDTSGGSTSYVYSTTVTDAVVMIHNIAYETIRLVVQLDGENASIPIQQRFDRNYRNPV